ncbi:MAG: ribbon-helix-helix domain-containing protein [Acidimicrobiia bacterium]|nr:ribbon-helix-helix domain-containing protein [bacterium]MXX02052.1 ribbon-helix-helix domain-containing protein [Acidimicrobiia bacterium]MDE0675103.1 ribbon-helix-helix domain-containing protein [bacterium]MXX46564.1 ribbon-helix-helix domain-containing protein [Acidimicrobiia bacterium]MXY74299.1 ribbon-helix-helix domain-containing protein [Acidimicrobiia bacterium]
MIRTQVSITEEQAARLRDLARERNVSQASLMREALEVLLAEDDLSQRVRRARRPVGSYRSGHSRTAVQHDEALDDAFSV